MYRQIKIISLLLFFAIPLNSSLAMVPEFGVEERIRVKPVFLLVGDSSAEISEKDKMAFLRHLEIAQKHYKEFLKTDTFVLADIAAVKSNKSQEYFFTDKQFDSAHKIVSMLLAKFGYDRWDCPFVFVVVVNRQFKGGENYFGGGRTFNGPPNSGGGIVLLEMDSLRKDFPYPFQSTLVHELGHAFGLVHPDALGYDLYTNDSIMSYNQEHRSKGFKQSSTPGGLNPEEYLMLSFNKRVFPGFRIEDVKVNEQPLKKLVFLGPMNETIGPFKHFAGVGYELFYNGKKVNGPEAALYDYSTALANLKWNVENRPGVEVLGKYNGKVMEFSH